MQSIAMSAKHIALIQMQFVIHVMLYFPDIDLGINCLSFKVFVKFVVSAAVCAFIDLGVCLEIEQQQQKEMSIHLKILK